MLTNKKKSPDDTKDNRRENLFYYLLLMILARIWVVWPMSYLEISKSAHSFCGYICVLGIGSSIFFFIPIFNLTIHQLFKNCYFGNSSYMLESVSKPLNRIKAFHLLRVPPQSPQTFTVWQILVGDVNYLAFAYVEGSLPGEDNWVITR